MAEKIYYTIRIEQQKGREIMKKTIFSRIILVILALMLTMGMFVMPAAAEKTGTTLKLHFYRPDGDYEGWCVYFWDPVSYGVDVPLCWKITKWWPLSR